MRFGEGVLYGEAFFVEGAWQDVWCVLRLVGNDDYFGVKCCP